MGILTVCKRTLFEAYYQEKGEVEDPGVRPYRCSLQGRIALRSRPHWSVLQSRMLQVATCSEVTRFSRMTTQNDEKVETASKRRVTRKTEKMRTQETTELKHVDMDQVYDRYDNRRSVSVSRQWFDRSSPNSARRRCRLGVHTAAKFSICLLYTSDAADE